MNPNSSLFAQICPLRTMRIHFARSSTESVRQHVPGHRVNSVDATGAGDCFDGAFVARLVAGDEPVAAARYANAAAALATTGYGAVAPLPRHADVAAFLASANA